MAIFGGSINELTGIHGILLEYWKPAVLET
jgi:hypothetical protein